MPRIRVPGIKLNPQATTGTGRREDPAAPLALDLTGEAHHYLTRVLRLRPGDDVTLYDGDRTEAEGRIAAIDRSTVTVRLETVRILEPRTSPELVLICAVLKQPAMDLVVQKATELGTDAVVPVLFHRSVPRPDPSRTKTRLARWERIATSAASQCGRVSIPEIQPPLPDLPAALGSAAGTLTRHDWGVVLWEKCQGPALPHAPPDDLHLRKRAVVIIGPEGGLTADEVRCASQAGYTPATLGRLILRSETAAIAALTLLAAACGRL